MRATLYGIKKRMQGALGNPCFECDHVDIVTDEFLTESIIVSQDDGRLNVDWTNRADNEPGGKPSDDCKHGVVQSDFQIRLDDGHYIDLDPSMQLDPAFHVSTGDKVRVIIIKED